MKNSKFNPLFESIYNRFKDGSGFLAGDVVKFKSDYKNSDHYKKLSENIKQRIDDMVKTGNNIRVGRLHNKDASFGSLGGTAEPASLADLYEEVAPSFWRNLVTVPLELLETNNPAIDLPPVPDSQKDKPRAYVKPVEAKDDKPNKGPEINEQTKTGKKQTHADKGDYELATKNTKLANSNKYNDAEPPKVKGAKKPKELKETVEDVYGKMLTEDAEGPQTWTDEDVGVMGGGAASEDVENVKKNFELEGIFPSRWPIEKQQAALQKVIAALKQQKQDGSAMWRAQTIATKYHVVNRFEGLQRIIDTFVPERRTWPKESAMRRSTSFKPGFNKVVKSEPEQ